MRCGSPSSSSPLRGAGGRRRGPRRSGLGQATRALLPSRRRRRRLGPNGRPLPAFRLRPPPPLLLLVRPSFLPAGCASGPALPRPGLRTALTSRAGKAPRSRSRRPAAAAAASALPTPRPGRAAPPAPPRPRPLPHPPPPAAAAAPRAGGRRGDPGGRAHGLRARRRLPAAFVSRPLFKPPSPGPPALRRPGGGTRRPIPAGGVRSFSPAVRGHLGAAGPRTKDAAAVRPERGSAQTPGEQAGRAFGSARAGPGSAALQRVPSAAPAPPRPRNGTGLRCRNCGAVALETEFGLVPWPLIFNPVGAMGERQLSAERLPTRLLFTR